MLEAFDYLAKRNQIKEKVRKMAIVVIDMFKEEIDKAKSEHDQSAKPQAKLNIPLNHGKTSGIAIWVRSNMGRL